jgi:hypothetical protein
MPGLMVIIIIDKIFNHDYDMLKSDINKPLPFDVTDPDIPYNSTKTSPGK